MARMAALLLRWHGWACVHEGKLEADGGRVNGMLWVLEEEEGRLGEKLFVGSLLEKRKKKKDCFGFAAWLGICDSYSPACHICQGLCALSQAARNQSLMTHN